MKRYIVGLGEALWDMLPAGKQLGGAPANFAYHAGQFLGLENVLALSALGNDALALETEEAFAARRLPIYMPRVDFPTGTVRVTLDERGIPSYDICESVAWDHIPFDGRMQDVARRCRAVCYGTLAQRSPVSRSTIRRFLDLTPPDCLRIFDINLRQHFYDRPVIEESLRRARILKINDEELDIVGPLLDYSAAAPSDVCRRLIADYGLDMVVLTCGVNGSYVFTSSEDFFRPTPQVRVADTVGAGDSFTGAFCAALLGGRSVDEAHALAVEVSAYVCTQHGAMPPLPEEMKSRACRV